MPYLIDGHNLIGQMRSLQLDDPDDEAKLVMILQRFAMRRKVKVAVVFDRGHFGSQTLGGNGVAVRFARSSSDADTILKAQLRRFVSPQEWTLVSSDREIIAVAQEVRARIMSAREFADILAQMDEPAAHDAERAAAHAHVRGDQVGEWLAIFGVEESEASKAIELQRKPRANQPPVAATRPQARKPAPGKPRPPRAAAKPPRRWEDVAPASEDPPAQAAEPLPRDPDGRPRRSRGGPRPISTEGDPLFKPPPPVHPDEIEEWLRFFGEDG